LDHMAHCKRIIARFLRFGPEAWFVENTHRPVSTTANPEQNAPHDSAIS
jgi:hypothetical protein